ncbi:hypothetical protein JR316_0009664 [Psilocybe cubensis]|uniref:Uncharacterized protein n=1 Tax=Psilocybe cubensis TaxID=181762 RepID=A0ACB8GPF8_PSICU|nr:hypothetical protein JR316_0009664 [Psilocybe cubensis]KAH9477451.1 hypothetical protein JR316_0009664 [Psilocybe cubensis]
MDQPELQYSLPHELEEQILQYLSHDIPSLKATSLACHRFAYTSRKYLFNTVVLTFSSHGVIQTSPRRFMEILISSPYIGDFVQNLSIVDDRYKIGGYTHLRFDTILPTCLPLLKGLRAIAVQSNSLTSLGWDAMSTDVQNALEDAFQAPTLVSLSFYRILDVPLRLLSMPPSLKNLSLRLVTFKKATGLNGSRDVGKLPRLTSLLLMLSDSTFNLFSQWIASQESSLDISDVRKLSVTMTMEYYDHGNVRMLLDATASSLEIFCFSPVFGGFYLLGLLPLLLLTSHRLGPSNIVDINPIQVDNLRNLRVLRLRLGMMQVLLNRHPPNFSSWVLRIISQLNSENLYEISLKLDFARQLQEGRLVFDTSGWSTLDSEITKSCPYLRKFRVYVLDEDGSGDEVRSSLQSQLVSLVARGILSIERGWDSSYRNHPSYLLQVI